MSNPEQYEPNDDLWRWWLRALEEPLKIGTAALPVHSVPSGNGFYRVRRKGAPWEPVAIWLTAEGWHAMRNGDSVPPDQIETLWSYACRNPVTEDAYDQAMRGEGWDDEPEAAPTVDNDDPFVELTLLYNTEREAAKTLLAKPLAAQSEADKVAIIAKRVAELANSADRKFEIEKEPIRKQAKAIDDKWRDLREGAKELTKALKRHSDAWLAYLKRRELERQQKAREEAEKARKEADEKLRLAEQANDPTGDAVMAAGEAMAKLKEAEREAAPQKVQTGRTGARLSLRTFYSAEITNQDELYQAVRDDQLVRDALQTVADRAARAESSGHSRRLGHTVANRDAIRTTCCTSARAATGSSVPVRARWNHTRVVTTGDVNQVSADSFARAGWLSFMCSRSMCASISTSTA